VSLLRHDRADVSDDDEAVLRLQSPREWVQRDAFRADVRCDVAVCRVTDVSRALDVMDERCERCERCERRRANARRARSATYAGGPAGADASRCARGGNACAIVRREATGRRGTANRLWFETKRRTEVN
jgi:hypothetical protein